MADPCECFGSNPARHANFRLMAPFGVKADVTIATPVDLIYACHKT